MRNMLICGAMIGSVLSANLMTAVAQDAPAASQPAAKEPAPYAKLKDALPETFGGLKRGNFSGSKQAMMGMKLSEAEAQYGQGDKAATITILDYAAMPQMIAGMAAWKTMEIDNDSDAESSKTTKIKGYPALETYKKESKELQTVLLIEERYLVTFNIQKISIEDGRKLIEAFDFKKIEAASK